MNSGAGNENMFVMLNVFAVVFLILYFLMIRPRRKKERELEQQKNNLKIGDIVTTIGGIVGIVVAVKEDGLTIETGSDRNKIRIKKWAIRDIEKLDENAGNKNSGGAMKEKVADTKNKKGVKGVAGKVETTGEETSALKTSSAAKS